MKLEIGEKTKSGFVLIKKIETMDELKKAIFTHKSIFARHKMYPSGFLVSMHFITLINWVNRGWFFIAKKENNETN